jgi:hypothetical protein
MLARNSIAPLLWIGLVQVVSAADHKASIQPATASIESPMVGYFWSSDGLVAIEGISSAAHARSLASADADRLVLPPGQTYEWLERTGRVYVGSLSGSRGAVNIPGAWAGADLISFSSSAGAAVLYRAAKLQVIGGLPGEPHVVREMAAPQGDVTAVAISDDSTMLLVASSTGVYSATGDGEWRLVTPGAANAIAFVPQKHDAIVALPDQIDLLKDGASVQWLAEADHPVAIAAPADGRLAIVLNSAGREALVIDLQTDGVTHLALGAAAKDLQRGRDGTLIFIPTLGRSPWLMDAKSGVLSFAPELPDGERGR